MRLAAPALALCILTSACVSGGSESSAAPRNVLTHEELASSRLSNAFEAVERMRPEWLRSRGATSIVLAGSDQVVVYVDHARYGEMGTLRNVRLNDVREIRYLSGPEANHRYGSGHAGGVIHVLLR